MNLKLVRLCPYLAPLPHTCLVLIVAGLCHDLGHGPFSHMFEHEFLSRYFQANGIDSIWYGCLAMAVMK